jgi:hypothetical protein
LWFTLGWKTKARTRVQSQLLLAFWNENFGFVIKFVGIWISTSQSFAWQVQFLACRVNIQRKFRTKLPVLHFPFRSLEGAVHKRNRTICSKELLRWCLPCRLCLQDDQHLVA